MINLIGTKNGRFTIIKQGDRAVIGEKINEYMEDGKEYVAWNYSVLNNEANYYWGRYGTKKQAENAFNKKESGEYSG
jgi:hypothetical protein